MPFDEGAFEDWVLSTAPQFAEAMAEADQYAAEGKGAGWDDLRKLL